MMLDNDISTALHPFLSLPGTYESCSRSDSERVLSEIATRVESQFFMIRPSSQEGLQSISMFSKGKISHQLIAINFHDNTVSFCDSNGNLKGKLRSVEDFFQTAKELYGLPVEMMDQFTKMEDLPGWEDVSRAEAEEFLNNVMDEGFILRPSKQKGFQALSFRLVNNEDVYIRHYLLKIDLLKNQVVSFDESGSAIIKSSTLGKFVIDLMITYKKPYDFFTENLRKIKKIHLHPYS